MSWCRLVLVPICLAFMISPLKLNKKSSVCYHPSKPGRNYYTADHLRESHTEIIPRKIFHTDSNIGLRDIILKVIVLLKQNNKVVINDENCSQSTWESYVNMVKKKTPSKTIVLVSVLPKYGLQQLYWSRQYEMLDHNQWECTQDSILTKWFDSTYNISYHTVDEPVSIEGLDIFYEVCPLTLQLDFQADIPGLFLQWEAIFNPSNNSVKAGVLKTCQLWTHKCPAGRIFILLDLSKKSVSTDSTFREDVKNCMKELIQKLEDIPLYLYCIEKECVNFVIPPNPGLLATIQKSHGIDLLNKSTVLLYHDQIYSKMAEAAGVQCVNASKVLQKPTMVLNRLMFTAPRQPEFFKDMKIKVKEETIPTLPLYDLKDSFHDNCISQEVNPGIQASLYAFNCQTLDNFKKKLQDFLQNQEDNSNTQLQKMDTSNVSSDDEVIIQKKSSTREIPKWMLGASKLSLSSLSSHRSDGVNSTASVDVKIKSTVYVMSEQELVEVATDILKQAGREDILKRIQEEKSIQQNNSLDKNTKETPATIEKRGCSSTRSKRKKSENDTTSTSNTCTSRQIKSKRNLNNKYDTSTGSVQNKTSDILDIGDMDTENVTETIKMDNSESSQKPDTLGCNDRRNIGTVQSKRTNFGDILDDTFGEKTKDMDTCQLDVDKVSNHSEKQDISKLKRKKPNITEVPGHVFSRLIKQSCDNVNDVDQVCRMTESESSKCEPSLDIDPTKLFHNLDNTVSSETSETLKNITRIRKESSSCVKPKKPDLSFLDDIFG